MHKMVVVIHAQDGSGDENECAATRFTLQVEPADHFKQKQKRRKLD